MKAYEEAYKNNYYGTDDSMLVEYYRSECNDDNGFL